MKKTIPENWDKVAFSIYHRDNFQCQICGSLLKLTVHHIISRKLNCSDSDENLVSLCSPCHDIIEEENIDNYYDFDNYMNLNQQTFKKNCNKDLNFVHKDKSISKKSKLSKINYDKRCPVYAFRIKDEKKAIAIERFRKKNNLSKQQVGMIMYNLFVKHELEIEYIIP